MVAKLTSECSSNIQFRNSNNLHKCSKSPGITSSILLLLFLVAIHLLGLQGEASSSTLGTSRVNNTLARNVVILV